MADYININGNNIPIRASDPSNPIVGEIWYNSTTNLLKGQAFDSIGIWSTGASINTARQQASDFGSTRDALVFAGGFDPSRSTATEEYNGTSFSTGGALSTVVGGAGGSGTLTAGVSFGGSNSSPGSTGFTNRTNEYDGSAWATVNAMNTGTPYRPGTGTETDTIAAGSAINFPPTTGTVSEKYDGTCWTSTPSLSTARYAEDVGTGSSALAIAGQNTPSTVTNVVESWNDTSWTSSPATNQNHGGHGKTGTDDTSALIWGGGTTDPLGANPTVQTESWDGVSWTSLPSQANLPTGVTYPASTGTQSAAISAGGNPPAGVTTATNLFDQGPITVTFSSS